MRLLDNASSCSVELRSNSPYPYSIKPILFSCGSSREWIRKGRISRDREDINLKKEGKEKKRRNGELINSESKALQQISHLPFLPSWLPQDRNPLYNPALKSSVVLPHQQSILTFSVPLNSSVRSWILWSIKKLLGCFFFFFKWAFSCFSASWNHQWSKFTLVTCANSAFLPVIHKHFF